MLVKRTQATESVRDVVATMAVEGMYLSKDSIEELIKVAEGKKTSEELRQEVIRKYADIGMEQGD